jgi:hypothetical protein
VIPLGCISLGETIFLNAGGTSPSIEQDEKETQATRISEVTLHMDEAATHEQRKYLRGHLLAMNGVIAAACHDEQPHFMLIEYDQDVIDPGLFVEAAGKCGLHADLIDFPGHHENDKP